MSYYPVRSNYEMFTDEGNMMMASAVKTAIDSALTAAKAAGAQLAMDVLAIAEEFAGTTDTAVREAVWHELDDKLGKRIAEAVWTSMRETQPGLL